MQGNMGTGERENVSDSLISIFRGVDMFLWHTTNDENVSCEL